MSDNLKGVKPLKSEPFCPEFITAKAGPENAKELRPAEVGDVGVLIGFFPDDRVGETGLAYLGIALDQRLSFGDESRALVLFPIQRARDLYESLHNTYVEVVEGPLSFAGLHDIRKLDKVTRDYLKHHITGDGKYHDSDDGEPEGQAH